MPAIKQLLQRLQVPLQTAADPCYARGRRWYRQGMHLPPEQLARRQLSRLAELITGLRQHGLAGFAEGIEPAQLQGCTDLARLPVMTRDRLREVFPRLREIYRDRRDVSEYTSGGATSEPVQFYFSRRQRRLVGGCNLEMYMQLGWRPGMPRFSLWGREPGAKSRPPRRLTLRGKFGRWLQHTTAYGGYVPPDEEYLKFLGSVRANPGCAVFGFTSLLESCALLMLERGLELPPGHIAAAWTCSEMLTERQRQLIEQAFGLSPRRHYGSRECSTTAADCRCGTLHLSPRFIAEAVDPQSHVPLPAGQTGSLLLTDLFNDATPFIRYEIGDLGAVEWRDCACGRSGWCLTELAGRTAGLFTLPSGTRFSALCFAGIYNFFPDTKQWQAVRTGPAEFELRHSGGRLPESDRQRLISMTSDLLEGAAVRVVENYKLERSPTGKLIAFRDLTTDTRA